MFRGAKAEDTGIDAVYLGPQISLAWRHNVTADIGIDLPVYQHATSFQTVPDYRIRAGITVLF
jgi:hypothetical protein